MRKWTGSLASASNSEQEQNRLLTIQKLLETENLREFTEEAITTLATELREIIVEIRNKPDELVASCAPSKDATLKHLRNASIELNLALDQLESEGKTARFYKSLLACKECLEAVFEQQEYEADERMSKEEQSSLFSINSANAEQLSTSLYLTQLQEYLTKLASLQQSLHHTYGLLNEEDEIWPDQCNRAISTLSTMSTVLRKVCGLFDGSVRLPVTLATSNYEYMVTLYHIDEQTRKLVALLSSFRPLCGSTSKQSMKLREEIHGKVESLLRKNDAIIWKLSVMVRQESPQKRNVSRHLRLVPLEA